ncbi:cytidylate kinase family protein [Streptomyces sp.]|uniref:cytidylate kinase family protein n=1 Tax=Streptomyces sp. TaxID=1931 RepID=UPI002D77B2E1|nr:cytidylate kinase family protein [Streptomyces sp.]HET6355405.1 cytidylate kinase family protein [Streptomyces sp.]
MTLTGTNIAFAGLTAAGKTTHARLLAEHLGYEHVSATDIILDIVGVKARDPQRVWFDHMQEIEQARAGDEVDKELERRLLHLAATKDGLVLDTWAMAWICPAPLVRIWIDSDRLSRHWKCYVSQGESPKLTLSECVSLIDQKDMATRESFLRRHNFDLFSDHDVFDAVLTNTHLIEAPTKFATQKGIRAFDPVVRLITEHLLGRASAAEVEETLGKVGQLQAGAVLRLRTTK